MTKRGRAAPETTRVFDLRQVLYDLLFRSDIGSPSLESELEKLDREYGGDVYPELIHLLSHVHIDRVDARGHWRRIGEHRRSMEDRLGSAVDPRVALLDYFVAVDRRLKNPKIIEMKGFDAPQASVYRDGLTGLYNYRFLGEHLSREIAMCERANTPLSVAMIDVDDFKFYNDRNGHEAGNQALAAIARLLTESIREGDVAVRYGGEEFALILPSTPKIGAQQVAERARRSISRYAFPYANNRPSGKLTVSIGIATLPADAGDAKELLQRSDNAMYEAKANGKDQVYLFAQSGRSYRRIEAALDGRFRSFSGESHALTTVKISEGGALFVSDHRLSQGVPIEINVKLPGSDREIAVFGRVVRVKQREGGKFEAAVSFDDLAAANRTLLADYLRQQRRSQAPGLVPSA